MDWNSFFAVMIGGMLIGSLLCSAIWAHFWTKRNQRDFARAVDAIKDRNETATILIEINSHEFARAIVDDISREQAIRLKLSGPSVH
jgi:hypothetical protein